MRSSNTSGRLSRAAVHLRAQEFAALAGRVHPQVSQSDYKQAKREVTGEAELDRQNAELDSDLAASNPGEPRDAKLTPRRPR